MKALGNLPVTIKSLISTLIGIAVLLCIAGLATFSLVTIQHSIEAAGAASQVRSQARAASGDLARAQAMLYRAINLKSQNVEVALVRAAKTESLHAIEQAQATLAALRLDGLAVDPQLLAVARSSTDAYAQAAKQAADFVEEDAFNATMFMTDADQKYTMADRAMAALLAVGAKLAEARDQESRQVVHTGTLAIPIGAGIALAVSIAASTVLGRLIARPIRAMTDAMRGLANGDLAVEIPAVDRRDEVGQMAQAMLVFRENAQKARALQAAADQAHALKERQQAAMDRHTQEFGTTAAGVMGNLANSAESMRATAQEMAASAQRTRESAARAAEGANTSASNLAAVAAAAEQMSASINEISQQVARATQAVAEAVERATATDAKVADMADAADRVGDVVSLITDIAGRTNLLALNATIEAARAGEAGKGFAVVAGEVKALASQTARATSEISTQIGAIRAATGEAVGAVREVRSAISQVSEVATAIAAAVEQQASATRDIASSVQAVTTATHEATRAMEDVSAISETTDAASGKVLSSSDEVGRDARTLGDEITQFLHAMASTNIEERRKFERIPGAGAVAVLRPPGAPELRAPIVDISRGGIALRCDWTADVGTEVRLELPGTDGPVGARVVRAQSGLLALTFRQDATVQARVGQVLARLGTPRTQAA